VTTEPAASEIGRRLRQIRHAQRKSLTVISGRAGISASYLSRLESGERALDRRSLILALANALEVAPSEITGTDMAATGHLAEDRSLQSVRLAMLSIGMGEPAGETVPFEALADRVTVLLEAQRQCRYAEVGAALPQLLRDLHATLASGRDDERVLRLLVPDVGTGSSAEMQVIGMLTLTSSLVAAASGDRAQQAAALDHAADLAEKSGEGNALWFGFGPSNVGVWRMSVALESGDHSEAARIATTVNPAALPSPTRQSAYWREYGRALARLPRRQDDAVLALRRAELISPARIHRHPFMRSVLAELTTRAKRDAVGRELRGMAYRAGLPG